MFSLCRYGGKGCSSTVLVFSNSNFLLVMAMVSSDRTLGLN